MTNKFHKLCDVYLRIGDNNSLKYFKLQFHTYHMNEIVIK